MKIKNTKVVILCGGLGSRLVEETRIKPKPMVKIGNLPILIHIMRIYYKYGFKNFILALGYKKKFIVNYLREKIYKFPKNIENYYLLASLSVSLITCLPPFRSIQSISYWIKGYYYVNYFDLGFIKRGLVGTVLKITSLPLYLSPSFLVLSCHLFFLILLVFIFWNFAKKSFFDYKFKDKIFYYSMFLLSPVLFLRVGYDIGRMDLFLLIFTLLSIISIQNNYFPFFLNSLFISLCISIQLLIHDVSILFYSPLII